MQDILTDIDINSIESVLKFYHKELNCISTHMVNGRFIQAHNELSKLKVDISVITERLEGSIKIAGEPFYSELYALLIEKRDLKNLKESIDKKLGILNDVLSVLQQKIDAIREDMLTVSIILLIFLELIIALFR